MDPIEYFEVESPEPQGGEAYKRLAGVVLQDHDLIKVIAKLHIFIDPGIPLFIAVGITRKMPGLVRLRDFADVNIQHRKVTISIGNEMYLAPLLRLLWDKFGKERVEQPDRFTIIMDLNPAESETLPDMPVVDPSETLYRDLIYAMQSIAPEGFRVRRQFYGKGRFYFAASEDTLPENVMDMISEKFALMGETL
jgi:putative methanogenesis marker protein 17